MIELPIRRHHQSGLLVLRIVSRTKRHWLQAAHPSKHIQPQRYLILEGLRRVASDAGGDVASETHWDSVGFWPPGIEPSPRAFSRIEINRAWVCLTRQAGLLPEAKQEKSDGEETAKIGQEYHADRVDTFCNYFHNIFII